MAAKRLKMNRLKEIVRLSLERGLSQRKVARALRVGNGMVSEYLGRARAAGVGWPLPAELEDEERLEAAVLGAAKAPEEGGREKPRALPHPARGGPFPFGPASQETGVQLAHGRARRPEVLPQRPAVGTRRHPPREGP